MKRFVSLRNVGFILGIGLAALAGCRNNTPAGNEKRDTVATSTVTSIDSARWQAVEIVGKDTSFAELISFLGEKEIDPSHLYHWKNHLVIFENLQGASALVADIRNSFPQDSVKHYAVPFYHFDRKRCGDSATTLAWDNILLTANLVADTTLQREYMDYHATQFEKWPEVANGFCNARFQQLLVYRQGRQLMLVISIPKGESLDKLNPKTEENNPKVKEWNKMMGKYQEGIAGTKPGESWVFLQPVR